MIDKIRGQLVREDLSGVTFVRDCLQLQFYPPPLINVYSNCEVVTNGVRDVFGDSGFANAITSCIGQPVTNLVDLNENKELKIVLQNGAEIILHYGEGTFLPPEAIE